MLGLFYGCSYGIAKKHVMQIYLGVLNAKMSRIVIYLVRRRLIIARSRIKKGLSIEETPLISDMQFLIEDKSEAVCISKLNFSFRRGKVCSSLIY